MRIHELLSISGLPELETFSSLYALALGGFLDRERWPRAFSDETVSRFRAVDAAVLKTQSESAASEELVRPKAAPVIPDVKEPKPEIDKQQEIDRFFFRVEAAEDFYEVLAVTQSADSSAVKKAYHALAKRFHPDIFHQDAGTPLHARLQASFARVAQAYEMLKDSKLRASYDLRLQAEKRMRRPGTFSTGGATTHRPVQPSPQPQARGENKDRKSEPAAKPQEAEETFQRGVAALNSGNMSLAVALLAEAVRREPDEARYRAYYGRSLASNKQMRHQAEAELKAAISLDDNNATYRLMLAELYSEHGMKRRAQGEAQRVLVVDPFNEDALRLLQALSGN
jgi:curved DNA-binding protein CbpA